MKRVNLVTNKRSRRVTDESTGEILLEEIETSTSLRKPKTDISFYMGFRFFDLVNLLRGKALLVLAYLVEYELKYDSNTIQISPGCRKKLIAKTGIPASNLSNYLKELKEKGILREAGYDDWMVNPEFIWKGSIVRREDALLLWEKLAQN